MKLSTGVKSGIIAASALVNTACTTLSLKDQDEGAVANQQTISPAQCENEIKNIIGRLLMNGGGQKVIIQTKELLHPALDLQGIPECKEHTPYGNENFGAYLFDNQGSLDIKYTKDIPHQYKNTLEI